MFQEGQIYRRSDIHDMYGGNRQSGIAPSAKFPYIFIFSGSTGQQYGYKDQWLNEEIFSYSGEGQEGDMTYTHGNLQLRDHLKISKRVFLFEYVARGMVQFSSELSFIDSDYYSTHDNEGKQRIGIKFFFKRTGSSSYQIPQDLVTSDVALEPKSEFLISLPNKTERSGLVTSRVGQGAYRKSILHRWEYKCAASGFNDPRVLIASHILPWKEAKDEQRLDVDNGILLSPDYDALFDQHLISFDLNGKLILNPRIEGLDLKKLGISGYEKIENLSVGNKIYLEIHNSKL